MPCTSSSCVLVRRSAASRGPRASCRSGCGTPGCRAGVPRGGATRAAPPRAIPPRSPECARGHSWPGWPSRRRRAAERPVVRVFVGFGSERHATVLAGRTEGVASRVPSFSSGTVWRSAPLACPPSRCQRDALEGDHAPVLLEALACRHGPAPRARARRAAPRSRAARGCRRTRGAAAPRSARRARAACRERLRSTAASRGRGLAPGADEGRGGVADVAVPARPHVVVLVAEVAQQARPCGRRGTRRSAASRRAGPACGRAAARRAASSRAAPRLATSPSTIAPPWIQSLSRAGSSSSGREPRPSRQRRPRARDRGRGRGTACSSTRRLGVVPVQEEVVRPAVAVRVEQHRARLLAVAPGAPDLLVVALDARRQAGVDDRAHVGLVDAHAEGDGGHHHVELAGEEGVLRRARAPRPPCPRGRRRRAGRRS